MPLVVRGRVVARTKKVADKVYEYYMIYVGSSEKVRKLLGKDVVVVIYTPEEVEIE